MKNLEVCLFYLQQLKKRDSGVTLNNEDLKCLKCYADSKCSNYTTSAHMQEFYERVYLR